jgi:hypothetical protein
MAERAFIQARRTPHINRDGGRASGIGGGEHSKGFWNKIAKEAVLAPGGCWNWIGYLDRHGYGKFSTVISGRVRTLRPHRHAWLLVHGEILTPTIFLLHLCDNPRCCNPDHLKPGTQKENIRDAIEKGRFRIPESPRLRGEGQVSAILREADISFIRAHGRGRLSQQTLAVAFGVSINTIRAVVYRRTWAHVPDRPAVVVSREHLAVLAEATHG